MPLKKDNKLFNLPLIIDNRIPLTANLSDFLNKLDDSYSGNRLTFSRIINKLIKKNNQINLKICTGYFSPRVWNLVGKSLSSLPFSTDDKIFQMLIGSEIQTISTDEYQRLFQKLVNELADMNLVIENKNQIVNLIHFLERSDVEVGLQTSPFVHAKLYCFPDVAFVGSSNFTINGLTHNTELNLPTTEPVTIQMLNSWFDYQFERSDKSYKEKLIEALHNCKLGTKEWSPYEVFLKIIFEYHRPNLLVTKDEDMIINLTEFQQEGVQHLIQIINEFGGAMLADAVGLGKTFQAIEVMDRLRRLNPNFRRTLIICPAQLRDNWKTYLEIYGLSGVIHTMELLGQRTPKGRFDLIVIDESHNFRNPRTKRFKNLMNILGRSPNTKILLLTATPINTKLDDLYHQIKILTKNNDTYDPLREIGIYNLRDYFKAVKREEEDILRLKEHTIVSRSRREIRYRQFILKQDLYLPDGTPLKFPERSLKTVDYNIIDNSSIFYEKIGDLIYDLVFPQYNLVEYRSDLSDEEKNEEQGTNAISMIKILFLKRLESSIPAFLSSLEIQLKLLNMFIDALERGLVLNAQIARDLMDKALEGDVDDLTDEEALSFLNDLFIKFESDDKDAKELFKDIKKAEGTYNLEELQDAINYDKVIIEELISYCKKAITPIDEKLATLRNIILDYQKAKAIKGKKILIFSYFKDTIKYLYESLKEELEDNHEIRTRLIFGGVDSKTRTNIVKRFAPKSNSIVDLIDESYMNEEPEIVAPEDEIDILFSTDVLSEGQNLQDAMILFNYDLHWNPVRLIQRIGRIDRLKSLHEKVYIHNFFPEEGLETLLRLVERLENRLRLIDDVIEIDGIVMGDSEEETEEQQIRLNDLLSIQREDLDILNDLEARVELASLEASKEHLLKMLKKLSYEHIDRIPLGIHSGMIKGKYPGVVVALRIKREDKRPVNRWAFEPDNPEDFEQFILKDNLIINERIIERIILCDEDQPRYLPEETNMNGELFQQVIKISRKVSERFQAKTIIDKLIPKNLPRGNKKYYNFINKVTSYGSIKQNYIKRFLDYLIEQPLMNIRSDLKEAFSTFDSNMDEITKELKDKNIKIREVAKKKHSELVQSFLEKIYKYFDKYKIKIVDEKEESKSTKVNIELVGFLMIFKK
ncbi:MAG: hypothetical protein HZR80_01030 [Candidatus Heimdallarchaeota archaeon]